MDFKLLEKALNTAEGSVLIPEKLDPILLELANERLVLRNLLQRIPWGTNSYAWNVRTSLPDSVFYSETDDFNASNSTFESRDEAIKMLRAEGQVSNLMQDASQELVDALSVEIDGALQALLQGEDDALINGDSSDDVKEFDGLIAQIDNEVDGGESSITLDMLDEAIAGIIDAGGKPDLIVMNPRDKQELNKIMRDKMSYVWDTVDTRAGTRLVAYQDVGIYTSPFVPKADTSDAATPTTDLSTIIVLDSSQIVIPVLRNITYEEIPTTLDANAFRIKEYLTLAVKAPERQYKIVDVGKPS